MIGKTNKQGSCLIDQTKQVNAKKLTLFNLIAIAVGLVLS